MILAAGLGSRLQAVHRDEPKGFVDAGGGPIVARSVAALRRAGVREFVIVTGWQAARYRAWCAAECPGAVCVDNPAFATTGSLRSLLIGRAAAPGRDVVVVESDLLYEQRAADAVVRAPARDTILVGGFTGSGDEVWVHGDTDGRLARLTKQAQPGRTPLGELVGLSRLSAPVLDALAAAEPTLPAGAHYEDGLNAVAAARPIALLHLPGLVWCEIDDAAHLARARTAVWPRVVAADGPRAIPA